MQPGAIQALRIGKISLRDTYSSLDLGTGLSILLAIKHWDYL